MDDEIRREKISFRVTAGEKSQLKRMADLAGRPLGEHLREKAFSTPLNATDKKAVEDLRQIKEKMLQTDADIRYLKKSIYVVTKLLLPIASEQMMIRSLLPASSNKSSDKIHQEKSHEKVMAFFRECIDEAEKKFSKE